MFGTLISISGPTTVGKTSVSIYLAKKLQTEILSCDSRQLYSELKIGTCIPTYNQLKLVKHHFIGNVSLLTKYNIANFEIDALKKINNLLRKYKIILIVGGSGLYEKSVIHGLNTYPTVPTKIRDRLKKQELITLQNELLNSDPFSYNHIDKNNRHKLIRALEVIIYSKKQINNYLTNNLITRTFKIIKIGLILDIQEITIRIINRVNSMINHGLLEEAKKFYCYKDLNALKTIGYKELFKYLSGLQTLDTSIAEIKTNTIKFAKRQITWYRHRENVHWFNPNRKDKILEFIKKKINF